VALDSLVGIINICRFNFLLCPCFASIQFCNLKQTEVEREKKKRVHVYNDSFLLEVVTRQIASLFKIATWMFYYVMMNKTPSLSLSRL